MTKLSQALSSLKQILAEKPYFRIGVVGYSENKFDKEKAKELLIENIDKALEKNTKNEKVSLVSGLTDMGIPGLAYREAKKRGFHTVGYACSKATEYDCFKVDEEHIIGDEWGAESDTFLANIDVLVAVGGGKQSKAELKKAEEMGIPIIKSDLELQK
jgi:hypothetical protein